MQCSCSWCGWSGEKEALDMDETDTPAYCPICEHPVLAGRIVLYSQWKMLLKLLQDNGIDPDECPTVAVAICQVLDMENPEEWQKE